VSQPIMPLNSLISLTPIISAVIFPLSFWFSSHPNSVNTDFVFSASLLSLLSVALQFSYYCFRIPVCVGHSYTLSLCFSAHISYIWIQEKGRKQHFEMIACNALLLTCMIRQTPIVLQFFSSSHSFSPFSALMYLSICCTFGKNSVSRLAKK